MSEKKCYVCGKRAQFEVFLYDVYAHPKEDSRVFFEQDFTCPYLCCECMSKNEDGADGTRRPRGSVEYPFTNREDAQGFTIYRDLDKPWLPEPK